MDDLLNVFFVVEVPHVCRKEFLIDWPSAKTDATFIWWVRATKTEKKRFEILKQWFSDFY